MSEAKSRTNTVVKKSLSMAPRDINIQPLIQWSVLELHGFKVQCESFFWRCRLLNLFNFFFFVVSVESGTLLLLYTTRFLVLFKLKVCHFRFKSCWPAFHSTSPLSEGFVEVSDAARTRKRASASSCTSSDLLERKVVHERWRCTFI